MPKPNDHLRQAKHNDSFSESLCSQDNGPFDWAVTVSFYAALHYFDYWLQTKRNVNVANEAKSGFHSYRRKMAKKYLGSIDESLVQDYLILHSQSEFARYFSTASDPSNGLPQPPFQYFDQANATRLRAQMVRLRDAFLR